MTRYKNASFSLHPAAISHTFLRQFSQLLNFIYRDFIYRDSIYGLKVSRGTLKLTEARWS